jgi:hypothetical protein
MAVANRNPAAQSGPPVISRLFPTPREPASAAVIEGTPVGLES